MYNDDYETCQETYATLCVYLEGVDPNEVTKRLGIKPTKVQRKGETPDIQSKLPTALKPTAWFLSSKGQCISKDSRRHLDFILDQLVPKADVLQELRQLGSKMHISCYWLSKSGHGGPTIPPEQMRRLALLDLELWFDIYFTNEEENA